MSIYKRGRIYWSRIEHEGVVHQQSLRTKSKNVAIQLEAAIKTALVKGEYLTVKSCPTLKEFEQRFFTHLRLTVKPRTLVFYQEQYDVLLKSTLADRRLSMIDVAAVDEMKQWRAAQGVAVATVNHVVRTLRRVLHQAEDWHLITRAPKLKLLPGENQRDYVLSNDEVTRLIEFAREGYPKSQFQYVIPVLVDTGLRITEACHLKRSDIWLGQSPHLTVTEGKSRYAKRDVPLTARAIAAIEAAWSKSKCPYVFTANGNRRPMTRHYATQQFRLLADALNMKDAVLHSCRHTFCTRLGESGCQAFEIQKLAGHSSIIISQRYVHQGTKVMQDAIRRMEELSKRPDEVEQEGRAGESETF